MPNLTVSRLALVLVASAAFLVSGCSKKGADAGIQAVPANKPPLAASAATADANQAVCIYDGTGVRSEVGKKGKYVSSLSLGEAVRLSGAEEKDESGREFRKVELSDGSSGWVAATGIAAAARMGALRDDSPSYKRPDPLTASGQKIPFMTVVAVTQQKDEWLQLIGEGKKPLGWVKKDAVTLDADEVAVAILTTKKLREKDGLDRSRKVAAIIQASPNAASYFVQQLRERNNAELLVSAAAEEAKAGISAPPQSIPAAVPAQEGKDSSN